jgi:hypothetical protein
MQLRTIAVPTALAVVTSAASWMANAYSLQTGVMIDVGNSPVVFTATPPLLAEYWSSRCLGTTSTLFSS